MQANSAQPLVNTAVILQKLVGTSALSNQSINWYAYWYW